MRLQCSLVGSGDDDDDDYCSCLIYKPASESIAKQCELESKPNLNHSKPLTVHKKALRRVESFLLRLLFLLIRRRRRRFRLRLLILSDYHHRYFLSPPRKAVVVANLKPASQLLEHRTTVATFCLGTRFGHAVRPALVLCRCLSSRTLSLSATYSRASTIIAIASCWPTITELTLAPSK